MQARITELLSEFALQLHDLFVELFQNGDDHEATAFKFCLDVRFWPAADRNIGNSLIGVWQVAAAIGWSGIIITGTTAGDDSAEWYSSFADREHGMMSVLSNGSEGALCDLSEVRRMSPKKCDALSIPGEEKHKSFWFYVLLTCEL